ncbi:AraC family transcriptional regulator [Plantibacter flavus]|uniref:helix-turn-helix transcriptional regulator n=1 Tax=Plantibacter flavus TaxID=150123 RepID=UPI003F1867C2
MELVGEGFPGQRMLVLPRPQVELALQRPVTRNLIVTDCGYFPHAEHHGWIRTRPIRQLVVILCLRGQGWCETSAGRFPVRAGQALLLPPGLPHAYGADADDPWTVWWVHVDGASVEDFLRVTGATIDSVVREIPDIYGSAALMEEIVRWMERDTTEASLVGASGTAWHLLTSLAFSRAPSAGNAQDMVERAADYLRSHINRRVNVSDLADMAGMSASHFAAMFKKYTGVPAMTYQTQLRMASARELLDTTQQSVEEVANAVGYDDSFYFSRQFKKLHGMSPTAYRRHDAN